MAPLSKSVYAISAVVCFVLALIAAYTVQCIVTWTATVPRQDVSTILSTPAFWIPTGVFVVVFGATFVLCYAGIMCYCCCNQCCFEEDDDDETIHGKYVELDTISTNEESNRRKYFDAKPNRVSLSDKTKARIKAQKKADKKALIENKKRNNGVYVI